MEPSIRSLLINRDLSFDLTIKAIQDGGQRIVLVVDKSKKLIGTITDGDIRRALIRFSSFDINAEKVMNSNPITASEESNSSSLIALMRNKGIFHLPILDSNGLIKDLKTLESLTSIERKENSVFIMAGGFGKRLRPLTNKLPKPMLRVGGRPILENIIKNFMNAGFYKFIISVHYMGDLIKDYFGDGSDLGIKIDYVFEEEPLGTAGAIGLLKERSAHPMIVMNGDLITQIDFNALLDFHILENSSLTVCTRDFEYQVPFGVIKIKNYKITEIIEKPTEKYFVNAGIYAISPEVIGRIASNVYLDMPDLIEKLIKAKENVSVFPIHEYWQDIGRVEEYKKANQDAGILSGD